MNAAEKRAVVAGTTMMYATRFLQSLSLKNATNFVPGPKPTSLVVDVKGRLAESNLKETVKLIWSGDRLEYVRSLAVCVCVCMSLSVCVARYICMHVCVIIDVSVYCCAFLCVSVVIGDLVCANPILN